MFQPRTFLSCFSLIAWGLGSILTNGCNRKVVEVGVVETATPTPTATPQLTGRALLDEKKIAFTPEEFVRVAGLGDLELIQAFLIAGMSPDSRDLAGTTALVAASSLDRSEATGLLIQAGASVNLTDQRQRTPLMQAAEFGSMDVVLALLQAGASASLADSHGQTAFALALSESRISVAEHFFKVGLAPTEVMTNAAGLLPLTVQTGNRDLLVRLLACQPRGLYWQDLVANRFLQAFWEGDVELIHALRLAHATPPRLPGHQQNLLAYAVAWNAPEKVQTLLGEGISPDEVLIPTDDYDFLNLLNTKKLRTLVERDENVTPLILAAALGYNEVMEALLEAGANRYATTKRSVSAVDFVGGNWPLLELLLPPDPKRLPPYRVIIDLSEQWAYYYEGERLVMKCIVSSGRPGFETPTGRFLVTDKHRSKISSIYDVEMPYFMRLNGGAVGMHSGPTNGHPISHGCIRMPDGAAKMFFQRAPVGTLVTIEH